jgi:hypothetical protein
MLPPAQNIYVVILNAVKDPCICRCLFCFDRLELHPIRNSPLKIPLSLLTVSPPPHNS